MLGSLIDKALSVVAPAWAARRTQDRMRYTALAAYAAGESSRLDRDWKPRNVSADSAILAEYEKVLTRGRDTCRNNWAGKSIRKAWERNVIGCGITPAAVAKDEQGNERAEFNEERDRLFNHWASRAKFCDIEKKQTFWRKTKMAMGEMVEVGQHFIVWSYVPNPETVGLVLQSFEPEQLDFVKLVNSDNGNQIRRGIEVDDYGAAVAFWFYPRPINDYYGFQPAGVSGSLFWESKRIPAERVMHFFDQDRTRQTHGISWVAPVMVKLRDVHTMDQAALRKAKVEASIAVTINRQPADSRTTMGAGGFGLPARTTGDTGPDTKSKDGGRQYQFEEAMVFDALPGETIAAVPNQNGGQNYDAFIKGNLRAAGAGVGLSYDVVARDYDNGSYSAKRQGALEDRREYSGVQDLVIDVCCQPVIELFTRFAILEGRIKLSPEDEQDFYADPAPWMETEWNPDGFEWIDPAKEATGASIRLDKRLDTRKNIIGGRGGNWRRVFQQIKDEQTAAADLGITLPDVEPMPPKAAGDAAPAPAPADGASDDAGEGDKATGGRGDGANKTAGGE